MAMLQLTLPGSADLVGGGVLAVLFVAVFAIAELLWRRFHVDTEVTRKLVHIGGGVIVLLVPHLLTSIWSALALAASFAVVLSAARTWRWLPSVHAIERASVGAVVFPVAVAVCVIASRGAFALFEIPLLALALGDAAAALVGQRFGVVVYRVAGARRTLEGSAAFAVVVVVVAAVFFRLAGIDLRTALLLATSTALVLTVVEALSIGGWDNLTIPVVGLVVVKLALWSATFVEPVRDMVAFSASVTAVVVVAALAVFAFVVVPVVPVVSHPGRAS